MFLRCPGEFSALILGDRISGHQETMLGDKPKCGLTLATLFS